MLVIVWLFGFFFSFGGGVVGVESGIGVVESWLNSYELCLVGFLGIFIFRLVWFFVFEVVFDVLVEVCLG